MPRIQKPEETPSPKAVTAPLGYGQAVKSIDEPSAPLGYGQAVKSIRRAQCSPRLRSGRQVTRRAQCSPRLRSGRQRLPSGGKQTSYPLQTLTVPANKTNRFSVKLLPAPLHLARKHSVKPFMVLCPRSPKCRRRMLLTRAFKPFGASPLRSIRSPTKPTKRFGQSRNS